MSTQTMTQEQIEVLKERIEAQKKEILRLQELVDLLTKSKEYEI